MHFTSARLTEILGAFSRSKILVIGDLMLDEFLWGKVTRISPEAPVPIVEVQRRASYLGGAANVARNLASLGAPTCVSGVIGEDEPGRQLVQLFQEGHISTGSVRKTPTRQTTHKTRICAITQQLHDHLDIEDQQQIVRVDDESHAPLDPESKKWLFDRLRKEIATHDAVIIEDYAKGLIDQELATLVITEAKAHNKIVAVDPNPNNPLNWSGASVLKPNRKEAFQMAGLPFSKDEDAVLKAGAMLQKQHSIQYLLITLTEAGMFLLEEGQKPYHSPTKALEISDVSGAGDTSIAAFTLALAAGATGVEAVEIANHAAGVVVAKLGTATLNTEELKAMFTKTQGTV
jgi:D-beta-D-heptose 7-phosphate kinase/D-beta-D-heptose 1-phosphate adenosyltransferase